MNLTEKIEGMDVVLFGKFLKTAPLLGERHLYEKIFNYLYELYSSNLQDSFKKRELNIEAEFFREDLESGKRYNDYIVKFPNEGKNILSYTYLKINYPDFYLPEVFHGEIEVFVPLNKFEEELVVLGRKVKTAKEIMKTVKRIQKENGITKEDLRVKRKDKIHLLKREESDIPNYKPACERIFEGNYAGVLNDRLNHPEKLSGLDHLILDMSSSGLFGMYCGENCPGYEKIPIKAFESPFGDQICCRRMVKDYVGKGTKQEWEDFKEKVENYRKKIKF